MIKLDHKNASALSDKYVLRMPGDVNRVNLEFAAKLFSVSAQSACFKHNLTAALHSAVSPGRQTARTHTKTT